MAAHHLNSAGIGIIDNIDPMRQWIFELGALFTKMIYWQKFKALNIVRNDIVPENVTSHYLPGYISPRSLCD
jgi:hypothetical protein